MFDNITEEMISELGSIDLERFNFIRESLERKELTPPLVVRRFSDLAFSLAQKSMRLGVGVPIAEPLLKIFEEYLISPFISIETKEKMNLLIGETKLDFIYASGEHNISSLRLASYLMAREGRFSSN